MLKWLLIGILSISCGLIYGQTDAGHFIEVKVISSCKGDSVQIEAQTNGTFQGWKNGSGKTDDVARPFDLRTWVCPGNVSTYTATASFPNQNFVQNGDFEQDTFGFSSDYKKANKVNDQGLFTVGTSTNSSFSIVPKDKTTGSGNMLFADCSTDTTKAFYKVSFNVQAGTSYLFSAWFCHTHKDFRDSTTSTPYALLRVDVDNGNALGTFKVPKDTLWHQAKFTYTPTISSTLTLRIRSLTKKSSGNDIAMDEVYFIQNGLGEMSTASLMVQSCSTASDVFSPDGDGNYDTYQIKEQGIAKIYDLGGMLVRELVVPAIWEGTDKYGQLLNAGFYAIVVNGETVYRVSLMR